MDKKARKVEQLDEMEAMWGRKAEVKEDRETGGSESAQKEDHGTGWSETAQKEDRETGWSETVQKEDHGTGWSESTQKEEDRKAGWSKEEKVVEETTMEWDKNTERSDGMEEIKREQKGMDKRKEGRKKRYRLTGSFGAKILVFFILGISCFVTLGAAIVSLYIGSEYFYTESLNNVLKETLYGDSINTMFKVASYIERGEEGLAADVCRDKNIDFELVWIDESGRKNVLWDTGIDYDTKLTMDQYISFDIDDSPELIILNHHVIRDGEMYLFRIYINPDFPEEDEFRRTAGVVTWVYNARYLFIGTAVAGVFLSVLCFLFLLCSAGHRNDREGIVPGVLTGVPVDILTFVFGGMVVIFAIFIVETGYHMDDQLLAVLWVLAGTILVLWLTFYFMDIAIRVKLGKGLRHSLIYMIWRWFGRMLRAIARGFVALVSGIPLVMSTLIIYLGIFIVEFIVVCMVVWSSNSIVLWGLEKVVLLFAVMYVALNCRKLLEASRALAEGRDDYEVDTSRMIGAFKEHGENLNSLGQGITKAVAERMRSEHLKTELITNVSHDIKTPLTSIINYADLICEEAGINGAVKTDDKLVSADTASAVDNARIAEYAEVLLRQSRRLKKLLEDLVEASKAVTGNLEVNLEPCEVGVLLSQAAGEYQQRMEEKQLELIARQPETPVEIMADGRRLWRVFDNLLNNVCKYAQENSRVYLSVEIREEKVLIIFRNMSKYPLDISAEELEERFVRGDRSRHMEGNGLGLSIAKSLVELQNGRMDITIDGDLFKVILSFHLLSN